MDRAWFESRLKETGKTKIGLARALNVQPSAVSRMLRGTRQVKAAEISAIAAYLDVLPGLILDMAAPARDANLELDERALVVALQVFRAELFAGNGPATFDAILPNAIRTYLRTAGHVPVPVIGKGE